MAAKRKQVLLAKDDMEIEWEQLKSIGSQCKKGKLEGRNAKAELIMTQLVEFNKNKHCYTPVPEVKEKQYVKLDNGYSYEGIYNSVWTYYVTEMNLNIHESTHRMSLLLGKCGPRAKDTDELCGKKSFLVHFEQIQGAVGMSSATSLPRNRVFTGISEPENISSVSERSGTSIIMLSGSPAQSLGSPFQAKIVDNFAPAIKKSVVPTLKLTAEELMALGRKLPEVKWSPGQIRTLVYDPAVAGFAWSDWTDIRINKGTVIGQGGFREAFRCTIDGADELKDDFYVLKMFLPESVEHRKNNISILGSQCEDEDAALDLNTKAVQAQSLARILTDLFRNRFDKIETEMDLPRYVRSWVVKLPDGYGTVEEHIIGHFTKYLNNSMDQNSIQCKSDCALKAVAFAHFSYEYSDGMFMVTDLQGVGLTLTDPEVATKRSFELSGGAGEMVFGAGNMPEALDNFTDTHECNKYCTISGLSPFKK